MLILQPSVQLADPHICSDAKNRLNILTAVFDPLIRRDLYGNFIPALATAWHVADDAQTWTFHLRDDVVFHNGDSLTAIDVVASLRRACDPAVGGELGTEGVWASYLGQAEITATDSTTVQLITPVPMADLLELLVAIPIMPTAVLGDVPNSLVGSGPWQLVSRSESEVVLEAFDGSRVRQASAGRAVWRAEPDEQKRLAALLSGTADLVTELSQQSANKVKTADLRLLAHQSNLCVAFLCNASRGLTAHKAFRQALNYAINVERMIDRAHDGAATPLNGPLTPLHFGCDPALPPYPYDPAKARSLLADFAGAKLVVDLPTRLPDEAPLLGEMLAEDLTAVGLEVEQHHYSDRTGYAHMIKAKQIHDVCCFDSSPLSTYRTLREKLNSDVAGPWWQGYSNPQVNSLLDQASRTPNDAQRQSIYRMAYGLMRDDAPWIFLYRPTLFWGVSHKAGNVMVGPDGFLRLEAA
ncbi:MAG: ABC transporter substrate-binding protein [Chloroflexota bacterium]